MTRPDATAQPADPPRSPPRRHARRAPTGRSRPSRSARPGPAACSSKTLALSLDPAMRGWMNEGRSYIAPVAIDEVMRAGGVGRVVASENPSFAVGDTVSGTLGVQEYALFAADADRPRGDLADRPRARHPDAVAQRPRHARHDGVLRPPRRRPAEAPARPSSSRAQPARSARRWASSPGSTAAAWSASPAARRSATGWSASSASTPASTTRPGR